MDLSKLIKAGKLEPVLKGGVGEVVMLVGWRRKERSRKQKSWTLKLPRPWQAPRAILCETEGQRLIFTERKRQILGKNFNEAHDATHVGRELASAAWCYREVAKQLAEGKGLAAASVAVVKRWPWGMEWWKPSEDIVRNRVKAGALYWAEADRLLRAGETGEEFGAMLGAVDGQADLIDTHLKAKPDEGGAS